jgi:Tfp pilus assembly protein PilF
MVQALAGMPPPRAAIADACAEHQDTALTMRCTHCDDARVCSRCCSTGGAHAGHACITEALFMMLAQGASAEEAAAVAVQRAAVAVQRAAAEAERRRLAEEEAEAGAQALQDVADAEADEAERRVQAVEARLLRDTREHEQRQREAEQRLREEAVARQTRRGAGAAAPREQPQRKQGRRAQPRRRAQGRNTVGRAARREEEEEQRLLNEGAAEGLRQQRIAGKRASCRILVVLCVLAAVLASAWAMTAGSHAAEPLDVEASERAEAHIDLSNLLEKRDDYTGAEAAARAAIAADPQHSLAQLNLGILLDNHGDNDGAEAAVRAAIAIDPQLAHAQHSLGIILGKRDDVDGAEAAVRAAIAIDPQRAEFHFNLGSGLFLKRGDAPGAEAAYRAVLAIDPQHSRALGSLGNILWDRGDHAGAVRSLAAAVKSDPSDTTTKSMHAEYARQMLRRHVVSIAKKAKPPPQPRHVVSMAGRSVDEMGAFIMDLINDNDSNPNTYIAGMSDVPMSLLTIACSFKMVNQIYRTPLSLEHVKALLARGADASARSLENGTTALFLAVMYADSDVVRLLLAAGVDVHVQDNTSISKLGRFVGKTALYNAALAGNHAGVSLLLAAGADAAPRLAKMVHKPDDGLPPADSIPMNPAELMVSQGHKFMPPPPSWGFIGRPEIHDWTKTFQLLLSHGSKLSAKSEHRVRFLVHDDKTEMDFAIAEVLGTDWPGGVEVAETLEHDGTTIYKRAGPTAKGLRKGEYQLVIEDLKNGEFLEYGKMLANGSIVKTAHTATPRQRQNKPMAPAEHHVKEVEEESAAPVPREKRRRRRRRRRAGADAQRVEEGEDVVLHAEGFMGKNAPPPASRAAERRSRIMRYFGVFELQKEIVQGRPTYKQPGKNVFLFYSTNGNWLVGPDSSKTGGWWSVASSARTPCAITELWQVAHGNGDWREVWGVKVVKRAAFRLA